MAVMMMTPAGAAGAIQPPNAVPETWRRYAETLIYGVGEVIETADGPAAARLRAALSSPGADAASGTPVRIWVDPSGAIVRVETQANAGPGPGPGFAQDLQAVLIGRTLAEAPPKALAWPITVRLTGRPPGG